MKKTRQSVILEVIEKVPVETQQQLLEELKKRGVSATQATLSRDIRSLRLVKKQVAGVVRYSKSEDSVDQESDELLRSVFSRGLVSTDTAGNIIVIKTLPGLASAVCAAVDSAEIEGVVGTIAGENTIFVAMKTPARAEELVDRIHELI